MALVKPTNQVKLCCDPGHPFAQCYLTSRQAHSQKPGLGPRLAPYLGQNLWVTGPMPSSPQRKAPPVQG